MSELTMPSKQKDDGVHGTGYNQGIDDCMPFIEQLQRQNDALVARVARLEEAALIAIHALAGGQAKADVRDIYDETESESLAHIQADAVEKILNWDHGYSIDHEGYFHYEHSAIEAYVNELRQQPRG